MVLSFYTVEQQTTAIIERFGRFNRTSDAGLHFKIPFIETISGIVSLRLMQLDVEIETKPSILSIMLRNKFKPMSSM